MKIIFFTPEDVDGSASSRFRVHQFLSTFEAENITCVFSPFVNKGLKKYYFSRSLMAIPFKVFFFMLAFFKRFIDLFKVLDCDLVFIHRNIVPLGPELFAFIIKKVMRKPIVFDFDDAIYLSVTSKANNYIKWIKLNKLRTRQNVQLADYVIAGNRTLAEYARQYNDKGTIIPTVVDMKINTKPSPDNKTSGKKITIGWAGSYGTTPFIDLVRSALIKLLLKFPDLEVVLQGYTGELKLERLKIVPWSLDTERACWSTFDIGINPLPDNEFTRGKCGFKIVQYMALGIPSVVSPVAANAEILENGEQGFWANNEEEWIEKLSLLIRDGALRKKIGQAARQRAEQRYSIDAVKSKYLKIFHEATVK
ncbi:glycosyltransferase family 4 protein [Candidatus Margulisiibacteriota bacterium]